MIFCFLGFHFIVCVIISTSSSCIVSSSSSTYIQRISFVFDVHSSSHPLYVHIHVVLIYTSPPVSNSGHCRNICLTIM
ncbi:uncharacterized protein LACBIDRAFT_305011 [Laccaria bicolor S238N-H82]|uniref:Predicted protein n=1 Tax=Laccaria bicolor (strain S238N-H82 / ATCC MYA-4686) TaxID=486041 RepID=B0CT54_LACBS|nr:uncharacterized protein LACBIDRAFT_305011 [Laccaria bicolor S238N-H82]EDR14448.1 predicted protein [Laccaria bicolor S238N-H82]|eukprot:XP_001875007.1 predicted protein [Laccaria bicolor S238N-H82]